MSFPNAVRRCPHCGETHRTITNVESIAATLRKTRDNLNAPAPALNAEPRDGDLTMCIHCGEFSYLKVEGNLLFLIEPTRHEKATLRRDPILNDIQRKWRRVHANVRSTITGRVRRLDNKLRAMVSGPVPQPTPERTHVSGPPVALELAAPVRRYRPRPRYDSDRPAPQIEMHPFRRHDAKWPVASFDGVTLITRVIGTPMPHLQRQQTEAMVNQLRRTGQMPDPPADLSGFSLWLRRGYPPEAWLIKFLATAIRCADQHDTHQVFANCLGWGSADLAALDHAQLVDGGFFGLRQRLRLSTRDLIKPAILNVDALLDSAGRKPADIREWLDAYGQGGQLMVKDITRWENGYLDNSWAARLIFSLVCAGQVSLREIIAK